MHIRNSLFTLCFILFLCHNTCLAEEPSTKFRPVRTVMIETPSICSVLDRAEGNIIYLTTPPSCEDKNSFGSIKVDLSYDHKSVQIYVNGEYWKTQKFIGLNRDMMQSFDKDKEKLSKEMSKGGLDFKQSGNWQTAENKAKETTKHVYSEGYQSNLKNEGVRQQQKLFADQIEGTNIDPNKEDFSDVPNPLKEVYLAQDERVYLFWSSSMPEPTLRKYIQQLDKARDPRAIMPLRGFVNGAEKIEPTMRLMERILIRDPSCDIDPKTGERCPTFIAEVQIDPALFTRYNVTEVPTIVFAKGVKQTYGIEGEGSEGLQNNYSVDKWWSISGDAAFDSMLERINREAESDTLDNFIAAIRKGFY